MDFRKESRNFEKRGLSIIEENLKIKDLKKIRDDLEFEFSNHNYPRDLDMHQFKNKELMNQILKLIPTNKIKLLFDEIAYINDTGPITLFPFANVMRNFYSGPFAGLHGWHSDSDGELKHKFCQEKLKSKKYIFGKLQICFQANNDYGGNIDILSKYYKKRVNKTPFIIKFFLKIQDVLLKNSFFRKRFTKNIWLTDLIAHLMRFEKVLTKPISVIIFEHRLFHRGTPMKPSIISKLIMNHGPEIVNNQYQINPKINLNSNNKYTFYIHFGSQEGLLSYLYDRVRRKYGEEEIIRWRKQFKELEIFKKDFPESEVLFNENFKNIMEL